MKGLDVSDNSIGCGKSSVFIGIREVSDELRPLASIVRLQKLNVCPMFSADTFEAAVPLTPKTLWAIFDKELRMVYKRAGIEVCKLMNHIVKGSPEIVNDFTNQDFNDRRNRMRRDSLDSDWFLSTLDLLQQIKIVMINSSIYCDLPEDVYSTLQIRQMFTCSLDPLISTIQGVHMLTHPYGEDNGFIFHPIRSQNSFLVDRRGYSLSPEFLRQSEGILVGHSGDVVNHSPLGIIAPM